ncbi:ABC transporter ATP-binding protein [Curtobacterium ammoniigenes]|uniref:ABC transporter ATP-binding protein n=1 Tax=Curtobacterium ammoniigenes TaxID=395387 RepID=UPI0008310ED9|nr:ABC transporter ATP-binding protein [Curtobacterium ammoniigenes]
MATPPPAIEVDHLTKHYGSSVALADISFSIEAGETFALLGPNGAGKSTTVEILEGYRSPTSGTVRVLGMNPHRAAREHRERVGIVLQSSGDSANVTVVEQLRQFARYYPNPYDVDALLHSVGLVEQAGTRLGKLSGGQRRRVDVALGIIGHPDVLFLDEPTTGFDPEARRQFWDLIRSVQRDGTTVLLTTHYLDEAAQLATRAAVIDHGRIVDIAPIDRLGGEAARVPLVRWRDDAGFHEERSASPVQLIRALTDTGTIEDLEVIRPSLEDIYLEMIR